MKYLLLILIFLSQQTMADNNRYICIKYSTQDCLYCNMQLNSLRNINNSAPIFIVLHEEKKEDTTLLHSISEIVGNSVAIVFSDSLYYKYDSSERSKCYLICNNKVLYNDYLKNLNTGLINSKLNNSNTTSGNINYPDLKILRESDSFIYMGGNTKYILKVSKNKLTEVADTILLYNGNLKSELFKVLYGSRSKIEMDSFLSSCNNAYFLVVNNNQYE